MRSISRFSLNVLASDGYDPIHLIDIRLPGTTTGSTIRLTNAGEQVTWNSNTYTPVNISPGQMEEVLLTDPGSLPGLSISVTNVDRQMANLMNRSDIDGAYVEVRECDRRRLSNARDAILLTKGEVRQSSLSEDVLSFYVVSILGLLEGISIPRRIFQRACNYRFGDASCGADIATEPNSLSSTTQAGSNTDYVVVPSSLISAAGSPGDPSAFWANGYVLIASGPATAQKGDIHRVQTVGSQIRFYLRTPLLTAPGTGATFLAVRGCRKTKIDCAARHPGSAELPFGGFDEVPYGRIKPKEVETRIFLGSDLHSPGFSD